MSPAQPHQPAVTTATHPPALIRDIEQALEDLDNGAHSRRRAEELFTSRCHEVIGPLLAQHSHSILQLIENAKDTRSSRQRALDHVLVLAALGLGFGALFSREALLLLIGMMVVRGLAAVRRLLRRASQPAVRRGRIREALIIAIRAGSLAGHYEYSELEHAGLSALLQETSTLDAPH